MPTFEH